MTETRDHDADEAERESFPASDPPSTWAGMFGSEDGSESPERRAMDDDDKGEEEPDDDDDDGGDAEPDDRRLTPVLEPGAR
jgi:hypothetical protein